MDEKQPEKVEEFIEFPNAYNIKPSVEDFATRPNKNAVSNEHALPPIKTTDNDKYMEELINHAIANNAQLCVTGNAFNRLFDGPV